LNTDAAADSKQTAFVSWQCRIRQHAVRRGDGRPTSGMRPRATLPDVVGLAPVTTVLVKSEPHDTIAQFRQMYASARSPLERYEAIVTVLQGVYYQDPREFSDRLTAQFSAVSAAADTLHAAGHCQLAFEQFGQTFEFRCAVHEYDAEDEIAQATYWHNALFNPHLPERVRVLGFAPDWNTAVAVPAVPMR
jgi:hypothetical protein